MTTPTNPTYRAFFNAVLTNLGATPSRAARRALAAVSIVEGENDYWNPLNWVLPNDRGFKNWNSTGVKIYPDANTGEYWTAYNLANNSRWAAVVDALKTAKRRKDILAEFEKVYATWGSHVNLQQYTTAQTIKRLATVMQG